MLNLIAKLTDVLRRQDLMKKSLRKKKVVDKAAAPKVTLRLQRRAPAASATKKMSARKSTTVLIHPLAGRPTKVPAPAADASARRSIFRGPPKNPIFLRRVLVACVTESDRVLSTNLCRK
jgi:hypothetical protein